MGPCGSLNSQALLSQTDCIGDDRKRQDTYACICYLYDNPKHKGDKRVNTHENEKLFKL